MMVACYFYLMTEMLCFVLLRADEDILNELWVIPPGVHHRKLFGLSYVSSHELATAFKKTGQVLEALIYLTVLLLKRSKGSFQWDTWIWDNLFRQQNDDYAILWRNDVLSEAALPSANYLIIIKYIE